MKKLIISAAAIIALSIGANAGGKLVEPVSTPVTPIVQDEWSGPYVGLSLGYISGKATATFHTISTYTPPPGGGLVVGPGAGTPVEYSNLKLKPDGFIGGIFAGINKKFQNDWLIGVEVAANYTNANDRKHLIINGDTLENTLKLKQQYDLALYARVGKVIGEEKKFMPYLLGGVTLARLKGELSVNNKIYTDKDSVSGWTIGAGLEYKINKKWHIRAQYRYSKYNDAKMKFTTSDVIYNVKFKNYKTHMFQIGVSYHFN